MKAAQRIVALGGAAIGLAGVAAAIGGSGPPSRGLLWFFAAWCVVTPYWWYLERRWAWPAEREARRDFAAGQALSFKVWLGFTLAMAIGILARAG